MNCIQFVSILNIKIKSEQTWIRVVKIYNNFSQLFFFPFNIKSVFIDFRKKIWVYLEKLIQNGYFRARGNSKMLMYKLTGKIFRAFSTPSGKTNSNFVGRALETANWPYRTTNGVNGHISHVSRKISCFSLLWKRFHAKIKKKSIFKYKNNC